MKSSDNSIKDAEVILPAGKQKMLVEQQKGERLAITILIVKAGLIGCQFWQLLSHCTPALAAKPKMMIKQMVSVLFSIGVTLTYVVAFSGNIVSSVSLWIKIKIHAKDMI